MANTAAHADTRQKPPFISIGCFLAVSYWIIEAYFDSVLIENTSVAKRLFPSDLNELWMRSLVCVLFIGFGSWAYSNWSLNNPYGIQLGLMIFMVVIWIALYFSGRMGKVKGKEEIKQLCSFLENTLDLKETKERM